MALQLICCHAVLMVPLLSFFWSQVEIPNILKQRKQLAKLVLDYDSAKTRYIFHTA